jgi:hypothetical protein
VFEKIFHGSDLYQGKSAGIDDLGIMHPGDSVGMGIKFPVDMSMDKISGAVFSDQGVEAVESPVAWIFSVMDMPGRGMGDDHVNRFFPPKLQPQGENLFFIMASVY